MQNYEHGSTGVLSWSSKGVSYSEPVVYAGLNKNKTGARRENEPGVWMINRHGKAMPLPLSFAKQFYEKPGQKYRFATKEELPPVPKEKIYPHDPEKSPGAQMKATTTMTGREVKESLESGESMTASEYSWNEIRALAKENDIVSYKRSKADLEEELKSKNII